VQAHITLIIIIQIPKMVIIHKIKIKEISKVIIIVVIQNLQIVNLCPILVLQNQKVKSKLIMIIMRMIMEIVTQIQKLNIPLIIQKMNQIKKQILKTLNLLILNFHQNLTNFQAMN